MSPQHNFDPNSTDAVFARLLTTLQRVEKRLDDGDETFKEMQKEIDALKRRQWFAMGVVATITFAIERAVEWVAGLGGSHKP